MEEVEKDPEEESEPSVCENQDAKNTSTHDMEEDPAMEEPGQSRPQEEEEKQEEEEEEEEDEKEEEEEEEEEKEEEEKKEESETLITPQKMIDLKRDLMMSVTNIQTAADAKESMRRKDLEEARRIRLERLQKDEESSQEIFQEITTGWSAAKQKVIPQELQEALNHQQQLCSALTEDKNKLISDLQQELKVGDERFVKDLRKQEEELDLMMERMENQIKTLTKAYRDELAQMLRLYQEESDVLLTKDKTKWEQRMKELWEEELGRLTQRKKKVEEYEAIIHNVMLEITNSDLKNENNVDFQSLERQRQQMKANNMITNLTLIKPEVEFSEHKSSLRQMKKRVISLEREMKQLCMKSSTQEKQFAKKSQQLSKEYKRSIEQYEDVQKKIKLFAVADARQFEEMWLMIEADMKQLVERVLVIDSQICKQHLGLSWERPLMDFMELSGPIKPQKQALPAASQIFDTGPALQGSQRRMDLSAGPMQETDTESTDMEMYKGGETVQSESGAEGEDWKLSRQTVKKVMELLCDEASFMMEDKLLKLLASLEKEEETVVKLGSILCSFGIEEEDVPKLAEFLLKYKDQSREQTEDVCVESVESSVKEEDVETKSVTHLTSERINPNHILPALKCFLEQHMKSKDSSARRSFHVEARDASEDEAYWNRMGNIISDDKMKLWDAAEKPLKQYQVVLTEISELVPEIQSLEQQNAELRMLLQRSLNSRVSTEPEMP
ncbi:dynein regulatory complex protein 1 isoform X2 [Clinocottus analis]|uniref:dynein regulatory complex protein 1 isoform X2 n=1 Tax=Clinocottus analis TaxID=304258 RepID=UPI0035BFA70B